MEFCYFWISDLSILVLKGFCLVALVKEVAVALVLELIRSSGILIQIFVGSL